MILNNRQLRLIGRLFLLLIPYSLLRIGFYLYHLNIYKQFTQDEIFLSFLMGIRFDIAAICLLNAPIIVLSLIPWIGERIERGVFVIINAVGFIAALDDYELFLFVGKRLSLDFFVITDDILTQLPQLILYYWYLPLLALLITAGFYFLDKKVFKFKRERKPPLWIQGVMSLLILGLSFVGIRGGLQHKSINVQSAFIQGKNELGHLVLNTPYHFLRTLKNQRQEKVHYFKDDKVALNVILNQREFRGNYQGVSRANVVLIILESFALEYVEKGYAPFLSELRERGLFFDRHLANGRRSIEALPSLLCGLPALISEPISKSVFGGNRFTCMPQLLKESGYTNYFFHAGARGTMGFESYTLTNGFHRYFSKEDYPSGEDFDGTWGIFDGPYLQYVAKELTKMPSPFLAGIFTLSSHQPYSIPEKLRGKFPKGKLEIHESIGYADWALREFFKAIEKEPWFKNTLFVITADHVQKLETRKYQNLVGYYRVPLLLYAPGHEWNGVDQTKVTHHSDIPDTVLDFVGIEGEELPATGRSVLSSDKGMALNYSDGRAYFLLQDSKLLVLEREGQQKSGEYDWDSGEISGLASSKDPVLKAYLQYFINGLINNNLSIYR